ncbi:hypothetical protein BC835DRAFT_1375030 [Cytidiella melzeri]|nr:hypothetical protein BC835DRAFT_1375030 [Cytidiella melzeri]
MGYISFYSFCSCCLFRSFAHPLFCFCYTHVRTGKTCPRCLISSNCIVYSPIFLQAVFCLFEHTLASLRHWQNGVASMRLGS